MSIKINVAQNSKWKKFILLFLFVLLSTVSGCGGGGLYEEAIVEEPIPIPDDSDHDEQEDDSNVHRNYLGISGGANMVDLPVSGVLVMTVHSCTAAETAGLQAGDIITAIGTEPVTDDNLSDVLNQFDLYADVTVSVWRNGETLRLPAKLQRITDKIRSNPLPIDGIGSYSLAENGILVLCLISNSPLDEAGVEANDIITAINGTSISGDTYEDVLAQFHSGDTVTYSTLRNGEDQEIEIELVSETPSPENRIQIGEITIIDETIESFIDNEIVTLENCNGTGDRVSEQSISREESREIVFGGEAGIEAPLIIKEIAGIEVRAFFEVSNSESLTYSRKETLIAAPKTTAIYEVLWYEASSHGVVEITVGNEIFMQEFTIPNSLRADVQSLPAEPCEDS